MVLSVTTFYATLSDCAITTKITNQMTEFLARSTHDYLSFYSINHVFRYGIAWQNSEQPHFVQRNDLLKCEGRLPMDNDDDFGSCTQALLGLVLRHRVRSTELPHLRPKGTCVLVKVVPAKWCGRAAHLGLYFPSRQKHEKVFKIAFRTKTESRSSASPVDIGTSVYP